ncbi:hypothetical protein ACQUY5_24530 [Bacillus cereus]|uniref:hypothetical protein n=1 Tax=Bacillus cereus TaxID=1396 RepID=UPI003D175CB3
MSPLIKEKPLDYIIPLSQTLVEDVLRKITLKENERIFTIEKDVVYRYILLGYIRQDMFLFIMTNKRMLLQKMRKTTGHLEGGLITLNPREVMIGNMETGVLSLPYKETKNQVFKSYIVGVSEDYRKNMYTYVDRFR